MSIELKIKAKHLATEPSIIRKEERKLKGQVEWYKKNELDADAFLCHQQRMNLQDHRKIDVRNEARSTHLARAFIQGHDYFVVEAKVHDHDLLHMEIIPRVTELLKKYYNPQTRKEDVKEWMNIL